MKELDIKYKSGKQPKNKQPIIVGDKDFTKARHDYEEDLKYQREEGK